jgi:hypothetical protein
VIYAKKTLNSLLWFLWRTDKSEQHVDVFRWTGKNDYVALCDNDSISFGGGCAGSSPSTSALTLRTARGTTDSSWTTYSKMARRRGVLHLRTSLYARSRLTPNQCRLSASVWRYGVLEYDSSFVHFCLHLDMHVQERHSKKEIIGIHV